MLEAKRPRTTPRSTDHDILIEAKSDLDDLKNDLGEIRRWMESHDIIHTNLGEEFQKHLREAARREVHDQEWTTLRTELGQLHDFKTKVETIGQTLQLVFGTSIIGAVAGIVGLILTISHLLHAGG